jgi:hypothetical protein
MDRASVLMRNPPFSGTLSRSIVSDVSLTVAFPGMGSPEMHKMLMHKLKATRAKSYTIRNLVEEMAGILDWCHNG